MKKRKKRSFEDDKYWKEEFPREKYNKLLFNKEYFIHLINSFLNIFKGKNK